MVSRLAYEQLRYQHGLGGSRPRLPHLVFSGSSGTGKTTVARLVGRFCRAAGLLSRGHCLEVSRADLVAGYVGQTALKTQEKILAALDGELFIDEAYSLLGGGENDYGREALQTLVKALEENRERLVVVMAGYADEMARLLEANPGLASRFAEPLLFADFSPEELWLILERLLLDQGYRWEADLPQRTLSREGLYVNQPTRYDEFGAIAQGMQMFNNNNVIIHRNLLRTRQQLNEWTVKDGKPNKEGFDCCEALMIIFSEIKQQLRQNPPQPPIHDYRPVNQPKSIPDNSTKWMTR